MQLGLIAIGERRFAHAVSERLRGDQLQSDATVQQRAQIISHDPHILLSTNPEDIDVTVALRVNVKICHDHVFSHLSERPSFAVQRVTPEVRSSRRSTVTITFTMENSLGSVFDTDRDYLNRAPARPTILIAPGPFGQPAYRSPPM